MIADRVMFIDFDHNVADAEQPIRKQGIYKRDVVVGSNVWIGYGAQILRGVTVGDNAIIGASAVVTRDIPANAVAAGTPARVVRMRPAPEHLRWPDPVEPEGYGPVRARADRRLGLGARSVRSRRSSRLGRAPVAARGRNARRRRRDRSRAACSWWALGRLALARAA